MGKLVILLNLVFAFLIFSPFFLFWQYILGSTDKLFHHLPKYAFLL